MQRNLLRAFLLALTALLVAAFPVAAQEHEGWLLASEDNSVLIAIGRDVAVGPTETADGLVIVDGSAVIEGQVQSLFAVEADVSVSGTGASVERIFTIGGSLDLGDAATVGEVVYSGTEVTVDEATVTVSGELTDAQDEFVGALATLAALAALIIFAVVIGVLIASLAMTLLVIAFGTAQTRRTAAIISNDVLKTVVVGVLMTFLPIAIFVGLAITVVGIPLALALISLWGLMSFIGQVAVATWIGERLLPRARASERPYGAALLGMLILLLLSWTAIVPLIAGVFGNGAITLAGWRVLRGGGYPPVPPGYYGQPYGQPVQVAPPPYAPPPYAPPPYAPPPPQQGGWPPQDGQPPASWPQG